jgi:hypothetical protein
MERVIEILRDAAKSVLSLFRSTREAYEGASRFGRMRVWILAVFGLDVLGVVLFVALASGRPMDLEVWFQPGFPSNMLVIRNEGASALEDVQLVLDGRYQLSVERLAPGLQGFEVNRAFRDASNLAPPEDYRPEELLVSTGGGTARIPVAKTGP